MSASDIRTIRFAATMLSEEALILRTAHTKPPLHNDWGDEELGAKKSYDEMIATAAGLQDIAERMENEAKNPDWLSHVVNDSEGGKRS